MAEKERYQQTMKAFIELCVLGVPLWLLAGWLPFALIGVAATFLVINNPKKFRYILVGLYTIIRNKQRHPEWQAWVNSFEDNTAWQ